MTVHELFEAQVRRTPGAVAVLSENRAITYVELNARANRMARRLRAVGVGPECLVAVYLERSIETIVAILAILKAGGAYLPLDPGYPEDRTAFLVADSGAGFMISRTDALADAGIWPEHVLFVDEEGDDVGDGSDLGVEVDSLNAAYLIYTSGSTGQPKGVVAVHAGACNLARAQAGLFAVGPGDHVLQFAALGFDASVWEILMTLTAGATLCIPSETRRRWRLAEVLAESAITVATLQPSTLMELGAIDLPALRSLIVAGEVLPPSLATTWLPGRAVYNAYGPTEGTVAASIHLIQSIDPDAVRVPIGRALEGVCLHVLDAQGEIVDAGAGGELYIGGAGVTRGYLGRPRLTAEAFVPDPFSSLPGARMYRTGDIVELRDDGGLEFVGRADEQFKLRGFRIEPGEIEDAILRQPGVRGAAVVVERSPDARNGRLVAYVVPERDAPSPLPSDLRESLMRTLPAHMIPELFATRDSLPLTPNGKIDRASLAQNDGVGVSVPATTAGVGDPEADVTVVVNHEGQYSTWPADRLPPAGWAAIGIAGEKESCLDEIEERWQDIRPASLRR